MLPSLLLAAWAGIVFAVSGGCAGPGGAMRAPLQHVVLIKLRDSRQAEALLADTRRRLSAVPAVSELWAGRPFDVGRGGVDLDWDVGVIVSFADRAAYEAYLSHPEHIALVEAWQPRWEWIRVADLLDQPDPGLPEGGV